MSTYYRLLGVACGLLAAIAATRGWGDAFGISLILCPLFFLLAGRRR